MEMHEKSMLHLNVSGRRFTMTKSKAREIRGSLFDVLAGHNPFDQSGPLPNGVYYRNRLNEYFFERSPFIFEIVLQYVYTGHLNRPPFICTQSLEEELRFWRLDFTFPIMPCCANTLNGYEKPNGHHVIKKITPRKQETIFKPRKGRVSRFRYFLDQVWEFCENPESSRKALVFNLICILSIIISIVNLVVGTIPSLQHCQESQSFLDSIASAFLDVESIPINNTNNSFIDQNLDLAYDFMDLTNVTYATTTTSQKFKLKKVGEKFSTTCDGGLVFDLIEVVCIVWFTIELILRFLSCPDKWSFIKSPLNIIDFLATFPFYIEIAIWAGGLITDLNRGSSVSSVLLMLRVMRVLRAFRVLRLARYFDSLQIMGETLWESRRDMGLLVLFLAVGVLIFSTILFYVEKDIEGTAYTSIPAAFWFAIVTLTTTGYGDVTPQTTFGKFVAGVACIAGVLILAFPVSILVEHFRMSYADRRRNDVLFEKMGGSNGNVVIRGSRKDANERLKINEPLITDMASDI